MCREVRYNVEALLLTENALKDWVSEVQRVATEFIWYIKAIGWTNIAYQFSKPVFVEVFTEMKDDAQKTFDFYNYSKPITPVNLKGQVKNFVKSALGDDIIKSIKMAVKK